MQKKAKNKTDFANYKLRPVFRDNRGDIFDIVEDNVGHVGMVTFNEGVTRGQHWHKHSTQYSYVLDGKIKLIVSDLQKRWKKVLMLGPGSLTCIPPKTIHTYSAITPAKMLDITTVSRSKNGYEKDTYRVY